MSPTAINCFITNVRLYASIFSTYRKTMTINTTSVTQANRGFTRLDIRAAATGIAWLALKLFGHHFLTVAALSLDHRCWIPRATPKKSNYRATISSSNQQTKDNKHI